MATEREPLPRKRASEITTRDTIALSRRFARWAGGRRQDLPPVSTFEINTVRTEVTFTPGPPHEMASVRAVAAWAHDMESMMEFELSGYVVSATTRVDDGERSTTGDGPGTFDLTVQTHVHSGTNRLLAWLVRDHEHVRADGTHVCPHCGGVGPVRLDDLPKGGKFECDPTVFCIAWDRAYSEYQAMPSVGKYVNPDQAFLTGSRDAVLGALFYSTYIAEKAAARAVAGRSALSAE